MIDLLLNEKTSEAKSMKVQRQLTMELHVFGARVAIR